jgi:hypothetical protein
MHQSVVLITMMKNIASRPYVFIDKDGSVYSSPNMTYLPAMPAYSDVYNDEIHHPREIQKLRWASALSPHLAYVPRSKTFNNPIFERLIGSYRNISVIREGLVLPLGGGATAMVEARAGIAMGGNCHTFG